jgi:hypothetical protein
MQPCWPIAPPPFKVRRTQTLRWNLSPTALPKACGRGSKAGIRAAIWYGSGFAYSKVRQIWFGYDVFPKALMADLRTSLEPSVARHLPQAQVLYFA